METTGPNYEMLAIIRLHLERLPSMTEDERRLFARVTALMIAPIEIVTP